MPIPVNKEHLITSSSSDSFFELLELIYSSRLINKDDCRTDHEGRLCYLDLTKKHTMAGNVSIVVDIIEKKHYQLMERWILSTDSITTDSLSTVHSYVKKLPLNNILKSMDITHTICYINNNIVHSCSTHLSHERSDFRSESQLKSRLFHCGHLSIEIIHDESIHKMIPAFLNWKIKYTNDMTQQDIHPLHHLQDIPTSNPLSPIYAVRRLSRLSLSAIEIDEDHYDQTIIEEDETNDIAIPIPSPRMQYTHHGYHGIRTTMAYSTSPNNMISRMNTISYGRRNSITTDAHHGCLVGSFEESLFSGRMSSMPSKPITFHCQIGVLGHGDCKPKCPPHWSIVFPASFYDLKSEDVPIPYVGTVDIQDYVDTEKKKGPGYRIPDRGQIQIVVKNPNKTAVKLFLIPYDVTDMPKNTKTFLRQKSYTYQVPHVLRYAIHIHICKTEKGRLYLHKSIRIVFANRIADAREKFKVVCEGPKAPAYIPL